MVKEHKSLIKASLPNRPVSINRDSRAGPAAEQEHQKQVALCKAILQALLFVGLQRPSSAETSSISNTL